MTNLEINEEFYRTFSDSAVKTLKELCQVDATPGDSFAKGTRAQGAFSIGGLIGMTSAVAKGSIVLTFPKAVFLLILKNMLGEESSDIRQEHEDAAAELLNIIFGQAKLVLNQKGYEIRMAIPSVLRGSEIYSSYTTSHQARVLSFRTPAGEFYVEFLVRPVTALEKGLASAPPHTLTQAERAEFFRPFIDGTLKTFDVQCNLKVKPEKPFYKKDSKDYVFDVAGVVGITSHTVNGSFLLTFSRDVFMKIVGRMLGETYTSFQPGLEDAVSEMVNIIMGSAKVRLNELGHGLQMAIPAVVHGASISASPSQKSPTIVIPFSSELGGFHVEVNIE